MGESTLTERVWSVRVALVVLTILSAILAACGDGGTLPPMTREATRWISPVEESQSQTAEAPGRTSVERVLPIQMASSTLGVPAGMSARYILSGLPGWDGVTMPSWSVGDLPPGVTAELLTGWGVPTMGPLQVHVDGSVPPGDYTFTVTATVPGTSWEARPRLDVMPCRESVRPGTFARTLGEFGMPRNFGGPTSISYGIVSAPLQFCEDSGERVLEITVESATRATGVHLREPVRFLLYRYLEWPLDVTMLGGYESNVREAARSVDGMLHWDIQPGAYVLYFDGRQFVDSATPVYVPDPATFPDASVTYRVEVEDNQ